MKLSYTHCRYPNWTKGTVGGFQFGIKHFEKGSPYGIDGGRISKLTIRKDGKILAGYDRGWDVAVQEEARAAYGKIIAEFNRTPERSCRAREPRLEKETRSR